MESAGLDLLSARELFDLIDIHGSGQVLFEDFAEGIMRIRKPPQAKHLLQIERRLVALDLKVKGSLAQVQALLSQPVDSAIHESASTALVPANLGSTQDITKCLSTTLQSEVEAWRHDLTFRMEAYQSRIEELHTALMTHWEEVLAKYLDFDGVEEKKKPRNKAVPLCL